MEINFDIPPPIVFSLEFSPALTKSWFWKDLPSNFKGFYGCSMARVNEIISKVNYSFVQAHKIDVDIVRNDKLEKFGKIPMDMVSLYTTGVFPMCSTGTSHFQNEVGCRRWTSLQPTESVVQMWDYIFSRMPAHLLNAVPFRLYVG